jgi:hypothetical protein
VEIARADARLARYRAERAGLSVALEVAIRGITDSRITISDVVCDLRARLDNLVAHASWPYTEPADRIPVVEPDPTGDRGLSRRMLDVLAARTDDWYAASAWWREDREAEMAA